MGGVVAPLSSDVLDLEVKILRRAPKASSFGVAEGKVGEASLFNSCNGASLFEEDVGFTDAVVIGSMIEMERFFSC